MFDVDICNMPNQVTDIYYIQSALLRYNVHLMNLTLFTRSFISYGINCMASLSPDFNTTALSEFDDDVAGQVYDADKQCEHILGPGSYFCKVSPSFKMFL